MSRVVGDAAVRAVIGGLSARQHKGSNFKRNLSRNFKETLEFSALVCYNRLMTVIIYFYAK